MKVRAFPKMNRRTTLVLGGLAAAIVILANVPAALALIGNQHGGSPASNGGGGHLLRQPAAVTNGLVGWWKLDGNAKDETANHNDGTVNNFTLDGTTNGWMAGKFGQGLKFNGTNTFVNKVGFTGLANINSNQTISAWFNNSNGAAVQDIVTIGNASTAANQFRLNGGKLEVSKWGGSISISSSSTLAFNIWHLGTFTYDGTNARLYVDGSLVATNLTSLQSMPTYNFYLGTYSGTSGAEFFTGSADDVRIYNRALSATEISQLYASSNPTNCDQTCVGYWKFDEGGSATTTADSSGNGNTGTLMNGASNSPAANGTTNGPLWTSGVFGNGLKLDGVDDYATMADSPSLRPTNITVCAWINLTSLGSGAYRIIDHESAIPWYGYGVLINNKQINFEAYTSSNTAIIGNTTLTTGTWYYIVSTYDGAYMKTYINGVSDATPVAKTGNILYNVTQNPTIGTRDVSPPSNIFPGYIDDVRVYSRALAPYEIYDQYLAGR